MLLVHPCWYYVMCTCYMQKKPAEHVSEPPASPLSSPTISCLSPTAQLQSPSGSICTEQSSIASSAAANTHAITIPDHWRPEVEDCLRKKCLTPNARQEIVYALLPANFLPSHKDQLEVIVIKFPGN